MKRLKLSFCLMAGLIAAGIAAPGSFGGSAQMIGGRVGFWPLKSLGISQPLQLRGGERRSISYEFPRGARQGHPFWYLIRVHAQVAFHSGDNGQYILGGDNNGYAAAQIIFIVRRGTIITDTLGLVDGRRISRRRGNKVNVVFENYFQINGVRSGRNTLNFHLTTVRGLGVRRLRVLLDSGIKITRVRPDELRLEAPRQIEVAGGERIRIPFRLIRRGGRADLPVHVRLTAPTLSPTGRADRFYSRTGAVVNGEFVLETPRRPGQHFIALSVPKRYNQPSATVAVIVGLEGGKSNVGRVGLLGGLLLGLVTLLLFFARRMRRRIVVP